MVSADSLLSLGIQTDNELYPKKSLPISNQNTKEKSLIILKTSQKSAFGKK